MTFEVYRVNEHHAWEYPPEVVEVSCVEELCQIAEDRAKKHNCLVDVVDGGGNVTSCEPGETAVVNPDYYRRRLRGK